MTATHETPSGNGAQPENVVIFPSFGFSRDCFQMEAICLPHVWEEWLLTMGKLSLTVGQLITAFLAA